MKRSSGFSSGAAGEREASIANLAGGDVVFGVVGLGYVGLPLAVEAAKAGIRVVGFDVAPEVAAGVDQGRSHIPDVGHKELADLRRSGRLRATTEMSGLAECDVVSICVPTPLSKTRDPDISSVLAAAEAVGGRLSRGQLIVLESTTYPGTTRDVVLPILSRNGLRPGADFFLCFSPERMDPANDTWKTRNIPKVVGGFTPECRRAAEGFYSRFVNRMVPVSSLEAAEMAKILENTFRAVNVGLVNEMAIIADRLGLDIWEVIDAAATKPFGFMKFTPGPGLGGHCLPVDPHYLSWKMRTMDYRTRFIEVASEINWGMPAFVAGKVREALNGSRKAVNGSRILMVGVAYKKDVGDVRESPALEIMNILEEDGADVLYHDPYVPEWKADPDRVRVSVQLSDATVKGADAVVIVADHSCFDYERIFRLSQALVDARNATASVAASVATSTPQRWIVKGGAVGGASGAAGRTVASAGL